MGFKEDLEYIANGVKNAAIMRTWRRKEGDDTNVFGATSPEEYYSIVNDMFRPYTLLPDPAAHRVMAEDIRRAQLVLSPGASSADQLGATAANPHLALIGEGSKAYLDPWTGRAAEEFTARFIVPFRDLATNQYLMATILRAALEAQALMWENARRDIAAIGNATIVALNEREPFGSCGLDGTVVVLTTIEALAAITAAFTGGATVGATALTLTIIGAAAGAGANLVPDESGPAARIGGEYTWDIITAMAGAINTLHNQIYKAEQKLAIALRTASQAINANRDMFVAPRPALTYATPATVTNSSFMGYDKVAQ